MTTIITSQREFAALYREKLELQARLLVVNKELEDRQEGMLELFGELGQQRTTIDDVTLYVHRQLWANTRAGSTTEQACEAMVRHGLEQFVAPRFNVQTLSSYVRELATKDDALPLAVQEHIDVTERTEIRARRS